jgi:anti-sigma B factor antagonist
MAEQNPHLRIANVGAVTVVTMTDRKILNEISINQIGEQLNSLIETVEKPKLVLNFEGVSHMSSSALGMLILLHKKIREKHGQLRLCCIQPAVYEVFVITRLNEVLKISPSQQDAVDGLL